MVDLAQTHPRMASGRVTNLLRSRLRSAFMQAVVESQHEILDVEDGLKDWSHFLKTPW